MKRCTWCIKHQIETDYHDNEWGVPVRDDQKHFEFILLDGFQAGLSWLTILNKRENFRKAFSNFDYKKVAKFSPKKCEKLLENPGIIRNKLKVKAAVTNAIAFMEIQKEFGSFDAFIWQFTNFKTIQNKWTDREQVPASTPESDAMSKALKKRGFKFVGSTICYAYMQAAGMVNDHTVDCFKYKSIKKLGRKKK